MTFGEGMEGNQVGLASALWAPPNDTMGISHKTHLSEESTSITELLLQVSSAPELDCIHSVFSPVMGSLLKWMPCDPSRTGSYMSLLFPFVPNVFYSRAPYPDCHAELEMEVPN